MFTFVTNATVRVAAALATAFDVSAVVRRAASDVDDVTVVTVRDAIAAPLVASFRQQGWWIDRINPPRPARGGTRGSRPARVMTPIVAVIPSHHASDHVREYTPEMDSLMRRIQRR